MELTKENFQKLDEIHLSTNNRQSMAEILAILSKSYIEITQSGLVTNYEYYKSLTSLSTNPLEIIHYNIKIIDQTKVLSYYKLKDIVKNTYTMRSNLWVLEDSNWKLAFHQGTKIVAPWNISKQESNKTLNSCFVSFCYFLYFRTRSSAITPEKSNP